MNKLAISIRAFNRADYLKQELDSLARCDRVDEVDFYILQCGAVNKWSGIRRAEDEEIEESLKVIKNCKLKNVEVNMTGGIGNHEQKWLQMTELFDKRGYDYVMLIDNDLIFTKDYISTILNLFEKYKESEYGTIQTSYRYTPETPTETVEYAKENREKVHEGFSYRWEMGFWRRTWEKIKPRFKEYVQAVGNQDFYSMYKDPELQKPLKDRFGGHSADHNLELAVQEAGLKGLCTDVLRHKTIGTEGYFTVFKDNWKERQLDRIVIHD